MGGGRLVQDGKVKRCTVWPAIPFTVSNDTRMHGYWLTDLLYGLKPSPIMIQFIANAASLGRWGPFRSAPVFLQQAPHSHPSWSVTLLLTPTGTPSSGRLSLRQPRSQYRSTTPCALYWDTAFRNQDLRARHQHFLVLSADRAATHMYVF